MKSKLKETMRYYKFLCPKPVRKLFTKPKPIEVTTEQQTFNYDVVEAFYAKVNFYAEAEAELSVVPIEATAGQQPFDYDLFVRAEHPPQITAATSAEFFVEAFYDVVDFYIEAGLSAAVQQGLINQLHEVLDPWLDSVELMGGE